MRLSEDRALELLRAHSHGFMATQHPERGIDVGPTVYAVVGDHLGSPVDLVKPKSSTRLQRERNLEHDPRATLAIEHWDRDDWSKLWWVRARLRWSGHGPTRADRGARRPAVRAVRPVPGQAVRSGARVRDRQRHRLGGDRPAGRSEMNLAVWVERNGRRWPDRPALAVGDDVHADWTTFAARVAAIAGGLRDRFGAEPG